MAVIRCLYFQMTNLFWSLQHQSSGEDETNYGDFRRVVGKRAWLEHSWPVMQRPKNLGGRVALPSGKFLRVRKVFARNPWKCTGKFADRLQNFQIVWIFSGLSRKFPDSLESFRIIWIFSGWSGKFPDSLESFWIVRIFSRCSGKFPDSLESFRIVRIFPDGPESFRIAWKVSG